MPPSRRAILIHLGLCGLPLSVALVCCARALNEATLPGLRPQVVMLAFMTGVAGPIAGLLPASLAIVQLWRLESTE